MNLVRNNQQVTQYFDNSTGALLSFNDALSSVVPAENDLKNYESNGVLMFRQPGRYKYVAGMAPIPPRSIWVCDERFAHFRETIGFYAQCESIDRRVFERIAAQYLQALNIDTVAVELSGGLDTALIIEVLLAVGAKIKLFGFESDAYAFRTERRIQQHYKSKVDEFICLDYDECSPLSSLIDVPSHPYPNATNLTYARQKKTIASMHLLGAKILLNGDAGDHLLGHSFAGTQCASIIPENYKKWVLMEDWVNEAVYKPHGITYVSAFAMPPVARLIWTMRRGLSEDYMKLWARKLFCDRLPRELSAYAYKGSHDGWYAASVAKAIDQIYEVSKVASMYFPCQDINPDLLIARACNYDALPHSEKLNFMAHVSYATWIHGLARDRFIS